MEPSEQSIVPCESAPSATPSSSRESNSAATLSSNRQLEGKPINKRKRADILEMMEDRHQDRTKILHMISNDENDISLFFKSIAASVKKLPSDLIKEAKLKTLQLVFELESRATSTTSTPLISPGSHSASSDFSLVYSPPPQIIPAVSNASGPYIRNDEATYTSENHTNFLFTNNVLTGFNHT